MIIGKKVKRKRSIGEAAIEVGLPSHVLRFWESKIPQLKPEIGKGGRRYYYQQDIDVIFKIKFLLHEEGYTIEGLVKLLKKNRNLFKKSLQEIKNNKYLTAAVNVANHSEESHKEIISQDKINYIKEKIAQIEKISNDFIKKIEEY